jgi:hypothetical protein
VNVGLQGRLEGNARSAVLCEAGLQFPILQTIFDLDEIGQVFEEKIDKFWVELGFSPGQHVFAYLGNAPGFLVGAFSQQSIEDVGDNDDSAAYIDVFALQPTRITAAVPMFMMFMGDDGGRTD